MAEYIPLYMPWLYGLVRDLPKVGVFPFATRVADATAILRQPYPIARQGLQSLRRLWKGGTQLGAVLHVWLERYSEGWLSSGTVLVIISDGWDAGNPDFLARALRQLRASGTRIVWINPLMATPGFEPKTRALKAARPYLERMVAGHSVPALIRLIHA
jgi:uncharacterized protein with von Willebrand factor type A (vWA) domain